MFCGFVDDVIVEQYFVEVYDLQDGYFLSVCGNLFGNVVKSGEKVILYFVFGFDFEVLVLCQILLDGIWKFLNVEVVMMSVGQYMESMECYVCYVDWVL